MMWAHPMSRLLSRHSVVVVCTVWLAWSGPSMSMTQGPPQNPAIPPFAAPAPSDEPAILVGAGDIANCELGTGGAATARVLDRIPGTVFTVGDHAYPSGEAKQFKECYDPNWGRHK